MDLLWKRNDVIRWKEMHVFAAMVLLLTIPGRPTDWENVISRGIYSSPDGPRTVQ